MRIKNTNTHIQLGNEVIINPILELSRDNDSYVHKTRDIAYRLLKDDVNGDQIIHEILTERFEKTTDIFLKRFYGHHRVTDTSSNVTSTYTDGETDEEGELIEKNLVHYLMSGGDITNITITNHGYADYNDVQQYFVKTDGLISLNPELPLPLIDIAKEVILNNLIISGKSAKELGFEFE
jgi:hypothetical protein